MFICSCELIAPGRRHTCFGVGGRLVGVTGTQLVVLRSDSSGGRREVFFYSSVSV